MRWYDNVRVAVRGTTANKSRSALTMLGVLIGVAAVIILVAIGTGSSRAVEARINALGSNTITVISSGRFGGGRAVGGTQSASTALTTTDVAAISDPSQAPDVASVSPVISTTETSTYAGATYSTSVIGSTPSYLTASDYTIETGQAITAAQVTSRARVVDIGQTVYQNLFTAGTDPVGATIQIGSASFQVVGLLATKGTSGTTDEDSVAIAPYTAVQDELTGEASTFTELLVQGKSSSTLDLAATEVEDILAADHATTVADLPYEVVNQASLLSTAQSTTSTLTFLLGAVAAISLLVGGIGVMNIMLVTVTERTREIGLRKAIGAKKSVILAQFLIESTLVCLVGGLAGIGVALVATRFRIDGVQPAVAPYSILLAFGVAIAVGIFFGFYPANRAASLRPIDALRYE